MSAAAQTSVRSGPWLWLFYALMIASTIGGFLVIAQLGRNLAPAESSDTVTALAVPSTAANPAKAKAAGGHALWHVLLALAAVIAVGQVLGRLFPLIGQPPVIGEVLAGIALGPSLLGHFWPAGYEYLLPPSVAPHLGIIAQLGVILYMFAVGLELDTGRLRGYGHAALAISHASIVAPFSLGALLALGIYPQVAAREVPFTVFALFLGVAMSITAFPVLARILTDRGLARTPLGVLALACAATDDVTAWCLLAFVSGVAQAQVGGALLVVLWTIGYLIVMFFVVRSLIGRWLATSSERTISSGQIALVILALLASALATEWIGIHAIFGAFILGAVIPHDSPLAEQLGKHIESVVVVLLLPAFFAFTGMRTEIALVSGWGDWLLCAIIILVATLGKFGGTLVAARLVGQTWRDSAGLGILMNTRGLMELIVLNVGLDLGIITPRLFAMMVVMAIATTVATGPLLGLVGSSGRKTTAS
ncbi:MAG: cation:proton antiporter [Pirellulaceae bacterium]|nr:cation:proton antiporter [Pirellulaceae bacterium]